jgi:hypothetical protein
LLNRQGEKIDPQKPQPIYLVLSTGLMRDLLIFGKVMQYLFSSGRNGRSILAQADVPSAAKPVAFFT